MQVFTKTVRYLVLSAVVAFGFFRRYAPGIFLGLAALALLVWLVRIFLQYRSRIKKWLQVTLNEIRESAAQRKDAKHFKRKLEEERKAVPVQRIWSNGPSGGAPAALRHLNCRITDRIQSVYPQATWEWVTPNSSEIAVNGGMGRIRVMSAGAYDYADVAVNAVSRLKLTLLHTMELEPVQRPKPEEESRKAETESNTAAPRADVEAWCDLIGRSALYGLSAKLAEKGFRLLAVEEDGSVFAVSENVREPQFRLGEMPPKEFWPKLAQLLTDSAHETVAEKDALVMKW